MTLTTIAHLIALCCSLSICLRLLLYRRAGSRFKRHYAVIAWLIIVASGGFSLLLLTGQLNIAQLTPAAACLLAALLILLSIAVHLTGGNIAQLIHRHRWHS